ELDAKLPFLAARLNALEKEFLLRHRAAVVRGAVVRISELLANLCFLRFVGPAEIHQLERGAIELRRLFMRQRARGKIARFGGVSHAFLRLVRAREVIRDLSDELR